jgi:hypothetical protein
LDEDPVGLRQTKNHICHVNMIRTVQPDAMVKLTYAPQVSGLANLSGGTFSGDRTGPTLSAQVTGSGTYIGLEIRNRARYGGVSSTSVASGAVIRGINAHAKSITHIGGRTRQAR